MYTIVSGLMFAAWIVMFVSLAAALTNRDARSDDEKQPQTPRH